MEISSTTLKTRNETRSKIGLLLLAYLAFISLGLPDGLQGVAWPSIRANFGLPIDSLGVWLFTCMTGYLASAFFNGRVMARMGIGGLLSASCLLTGASLIGYTLAPTWWIIPALGVLAGIGAGAIDGGLNTYIASEHSEGLMQWLHASFGIGITLGPIIMTAGLNIFQNWRLGYLVVGTAQIILALCFGLTASMWARPHEPDSGSKSEDKTHIMNYETSMRETLQQSRVWLSAALFFLYTGAEVSLGVWAYSLLTESRGIEPALAGLWAGSYWFTFTIGRILAGLYTRRFSLKIILIASLALALIGALLLWWNPSSSISLLGVGLTGFAVAPIFPGLVSGTRDRVGARYAANTIGIQISAAGIGATAIASLAGVLARHFSLEIVPVYLVALIATLFFLYYLSIQKIYN